MMAKNDCTNNIAVVDNKVHGDNGKLFPTTNNSIDQTATIDYDTTDDVTNLDIIDVCYSIDNLVAESPTILLQTFSSTSSASKILLPLIPQTSNHWWWWCSLLLASRHCWQQRTNVSNQTKRSSALCFIKNMNRLDNKNIENDGGSSGDAENEINKIIIIIIPDQPKKSTLDTGKTRASQSSPNASNCCLDFVNSIHTCHIQNYQHSNISMKLWMMITSSFSSSMHLVGSRHQYNYNKYNNYHSNYYHHYPKPHSDIASSNCVHNPQLSSTKRMDQMVPSGQYFNHNHYYHKNANTIYGNVKLKSNSQKMNSTRTNKSSFVIWWWLYSLATIILSNHFILPVISQEYYHPTQSSLWPASNEYRFGEQANIPGKHFLTESFNGGKINGDWTLKNFHLITNYTITNDIIINEQSSLSIDPAVQLLFAPGIGITVFGTLMAKGTDSHKIIFTAANSQRTDSVTNARNVPIWPNIRLVDGNVVEEGRLQIKYKNRWHSVCTNSRNWTETDIAIVCRQLGFSGGHWLRWFVRNNDTRQFMFENPGCQGHESTIEECSNWNQRRIGSGVCHFHQDIGIKCENKLFTNNNKVSQPYWKGIEFINSDRHQIEIVDNRMNIDVSNSVLEHVDIKYAGQEIDGKARAAVLTVGGVPPKINYLSITHSAYTAFNVTDPINGFEVMNSNFSQNRAYGIFVNSSVGRILFSSIQVEDNGADGVRFIHFDRPYMHSDSFCQTPNLGTSQVYPIKFTHKQSATQAPTDECCQDFHSQEWVGHRITVHFPVLMSGIEDYEAMSEYLAQPYTPQVGREGSIYVIDGHSGRIIADFFIRNNTKTQSVSSIVGNGPLVVCYRPAHYRRVLFTVHVVIDYGREYDVAISTSRITSNNGRGLWLQDLRSGSVVNRTLIHNHNYVAGLDVDRGVGETIVNNSIISYNLVDGINVTNGGGFLHIDRTYIVNNTGRGIAVWFNESINNQAFNFSSHITRCSLSGNRIGLLISNGCHFIKPLRQNVYWNISLNHFEQHKEQAILYHSCIPKPRILKMQMKPLISNISIGHNYFEANQLQAIHCAPLFFAKLNIIHNEFTKHKKAVLYINSQDNFNVEKFVEDAERFPFSFYNNGPSLINQRSLALDLWPAVVRIRNNNFHNNNGHYVANIGLLEPETSTNVNYSSLSQKIFFTRNILHNNIVTEPFVELNPRSRVAAVLCVSSSSVLIWRNEFINPNSKYELGVHLSSHFRLINASLNYWGMGNKIDDKFGFNDNNLNSASQIYERIFDRKNRYNLAQVEFLPYILIPNALETDRTALSSVTDREKLSQFFRVSVEIGGRVKGQVNLPSGEYFVKRDIHVGPESELVLNPGTTIYFDQSVGIFVQGKFKANGQIDSDIKFLLNTKKFIRMKRENKNETISSKITNTTANIKKINHSAMSMKLSQTSVMPEQKIRLSNGTEGRLEVKIGNEWGTVCGYNFDIEDAAVACHQLGMVLNSANWHLEKSEFYSQRNSRSILLTNVQCTHLDTDLTQCKAERLSDNDFEGAWCPKGEVGIRCFPKAWAGIRFGMLTQEVIIENVMVEHAGLIDYRTKIFGPALQFDLNRFSINNSTISSNIDSGIGIAWNDVITEPINKQFHVTNSRIINNLNHGIITNTQGIKIENCLISSNKVSGFHYEPTFSRDKQEELASWIVKQPISQNRRASVFIITPEEMINDQKTIQINDFGKQLYVYVPRRPKATNKPFQLIIQTMPGQRIGVMAISPIFLTRSSETLHFYSPLLIDYKHMTRVTWDLRKNLTMFPFVYPGYRLMMEYKTGQLPYGDILLMFTPKHYPRMDQTGLSIADKSILERQEMNTMILVNNKFIDNGKGITSSHCSMNIDLNGNYCKRYGNETIIIQDNLISKSRGAGLFVNSHAFSSMIPYSLLVNMFEFNDFPQQEFDITYASSILAEINYTLINNRFMENADFGSIVLYDHSLYSNGDMQRVNVQSMPGFVMSNAIGANYPSNTNLFHWNINHCSLEDNKNGGIDIKLPYTWLYNENFTHSVVIENCDFIKNRNFEFVIGGHYSKVNITMNKFLENQCKVGLLSIRGMEKLLKIQNNEMYDNFVQKYVIEMNMASHADKFGTVTAFIHRNNIRNNRFSGFPSIVETVSSEESGSYMPETYTISLKGLQQVNVTRNILENRNLQFELLAGVKAGSIHNELNATENYWGFAGDSKSIRERIFDFDDWNSFSTTIFSPWLTTNNIDGPLIDDYKINERIVNYTTVPYLLGGRLTKSLVLHARERPYIVHTDLTIMPGTTLTLLPGVVMEFYPSIGILVLGDLNAIGVETNPITLRPVNRNDFKNKPMAYRLESRLKNRRRNIPKTEQLVYSKSDHGGVRLCLTESCDPESELKAEEFMKKKISWFDDSGYPKYSLHNDRRRHGFLEIYNTTTLQWTPICDPRFTERDAQVVCRQLGFSTLNVFVRRGPRPDMDPTLITRISDWPESLECIGTETSLGECDLRTFSKDSNDGKSALMDNAPLYHSKMFSTNFYKKMHYSYIYDNQTQELMFYLNDDWRSLEERSLVQSTACQFDGDEFVYIFCGEDNNKLETSFEHWAGVRFAIPEFEEDESKFSIKKYLDKSAMHYVKIIGAGILHGEKNAAIQMIQRSVPLEFVHVENSAYHGIEVLSPTESLKFHRLFVENNLGSGLNLLLLGTSTSESLRVPYEPISDGSTFNVPYNAFSLVDICDARKQLRVKEKVYVYYKYDNKPVDCVKIFTSANPLKLIGIRFLQLNLWSKFVESDGKTNTIENDYIQGKKFAYQTEDIFHNKLNQLEHLYTGSYVDASVINSMSDSIMIWDGDIFNETTRRLIGEIYSDSTKQFYKQVPIFYHSANRNSRHSRFTGGSTKIPFYNDDQQSSPKNQLYKSSGFSMSLQLHVSGASGKYGFIAEVTTLPTAYHDERDIQHNITLSEINENTAGAIRYESVGESVPKLALLNNMIKRNCRSLWANFTTCDGSAIDLKIQNSPQLYFKNNLIGNNRAGGLRILATSFTAVSALNAHLINNLFTENYQKETLYFEGSNSYQTIEVDRNYFSRNRSPHRSNIVFGRAIVKFHKNVIINNYGDNQLFMAGFAHAQSSSKLQTCMKNFFYNNHAKNERGEQSTIIASTIGQIYTNNYFVNPDNDFELATRNRTIISEASHSLKQSIIDPNLYAAMLASVKVIAPNNWWGFNETSAIEARIRDSRDSYHLIRVEYEPFLTGNWSVLSGSCYGGYQKIADTCFVFIGGRMTYEEARKFCTSDNSSMPFVRASNQDELTRYIYLQQQFFDRRRHPVWVQSFDVPIGSCSVLIDGTVRIHDCNDELPFLCERDPEIGVSTATLDYWYQEPLGTAVIVIFFLTLILTIACICCWICKSRHRHMEKLERRNSIRASIRSSRSLASMSALNDSTYFTNRKLLSDSNANVSVNGNPIYRQIQHGNGAVINGAMENGNRHQQNTLPQVYNDSLSSSFSIYPDTNIPNESLVMAQKRYDSAVKMNGRNSNLIQSPIQPTFDLVYENRAFKGQSTPISPISFSSREDPVPTIRTWTPETNSTLDFKVKPALDPHELSQYSESTEDLTKPPPSTSSSSADSDLPSPSSVLSRTSNIKVPKFYQPKLPMKPINPPPPIRRLIQTREDKNRREQQRRSADPNMFLHPEEPTTIDGPLETTFDSKLLTFKTPTAKKPLYNTDLDENNHAPLGGSQPSLQYGSYGQPSISESTNPNYLETSLDNDNFDSANRTLGTIHSSTNTATKARLYASQPLETSM